MLPSRIVKTVQSGKVILSAISSFGVLKHFREKTTATASIDDDARKKNSPENRERAFANVIKFYGNQSSIVFLLQ